ncbi:MAG: hypothetical protein GYB65_09830, partial [Chloroflexi bacterium]|nr:hypothetical protein [Chloroflexota bacterium]
LWSARPDTVADAVDGVLRAVGGVIWQGDTDLTRNVAERPLLGPVLALLLVFGVIEAGRRWREPGYALLLMVLVFGLLTDAWIDPATNYAENLAALPAVYILPGIGAVTLAGMLARYGLPRAWQPVTLLLVALLTANVITVRERLFEDWRHDGEVASLYHARLGRLAQYLDRTPDDAPVSVCAAFLETPLPLDLAERELLDIILNGGLGDLQAAAGLTQRQMLNMMLHRDDDDFRYSDCRSGLVFPNGGQEMRFVFLDLPDAAQAQTSLAHTWGLPADWFDADSSPPPTADELVGLPPHLIAWIEAGGAIPVPLVYEAAGMRPELARWLFDGEPVHVDGLPDGTVLRLDLAQQIADEQTPWLARETYFRPELGSVAIDPAEVPVTFEGNLSFKGYEVAGGRVPNDPRNPVVLVTYWRVDGALPPNLGLWAQVLNYWEPQPGIRVPETGTYRTPTQALDVLPGSLQPQDIVVQVLFIPLPYLDAGDYALVLGAYDGSLETVLGVLDRLANGQSRRDWLWLGTLTLEPPLENGQ